VTLKAEVMPLRKAAWLAFAAMMVQDLLATIMVVFESQGGSAHSWSTVVGDAFIAGMFDVGGWIAGIICLSLSVESIISQGWRTRRSLTLIGAVSLANLMGTLAGVVAAFIITQHPH